MTISQQERMGAYVLPLTEKLLLRRAAADLDLGSHTVARCFETARFFYELVDQQMQQAKEKDGG